MFSRLTLALVICFVPRNHWAPSHIRGNIQKLTLNEQVTLIIQVTVRASPVQIDSKRNTLWTRSLPLTTQLSERMKPKTFVTGTLNNFSHRTACSHTCLLQGPPAMGEAPPEHLGWSKRLPVLGSPSLGKSRASPWLRQPRTYPSRV